ncbi:MAG: ABC transporter ATP-binding protein [bacterium]|nr:ABC transporter ATP-binding protein [bacterium]
MIRLERLTRRYGDVDVVKELSLEIPEGELLVLLGSSGCGKTTTLKMINRLVEPSSGRVYIAGEDTATIEPAQLRLRIGYCFQQIGLFPHMTAGENIALTPGLLGWDEQRTSKRVSELLELVELEPDVFRTRFPDELSGGQQQRVGIARALAGRPELLLMDEPFGALDPLTRDTLQRALQSIRSDLGITTVFVTHDMVEALILGDRIAVMNAGRLVQVGTPQELLNAPADEEVSRMMDTPRHQAERVESLLRRDRPVDG